jgi:hypothetical protein
MLSVSDPTAAVVTGEGGVRPVPVLEVLGRFLPLWLAWLVVVVLGRLVCRVAQRIPPVVRLVRRLRTGGEAALRPCPGDGVQPSSDE